MSQTNTVTVNGPWANVLTGSGKAALEETLPDYLRARRWFGGKARTISSVEIEQAIAVTENSSEAYITLLRVNYVDGDPQTYMLPLTFSKEQHAEQIAGTRPQAVVARVRVTGEDGKATEGVLYDASWDNEFAGALLRAIEGGDCFGHPTGEVCASPTRAFDRIAGEDGVSLEPTILGAEQSNTSIKYGDKFIMKLYRRLEEGINPDFEIGRFLTEKGFSHIPPLAGAIEYAREDRDPVSMAILQGFIANQGDAWQYTLGELNKYFYRAGKEQGELEGILPERQHPLELQDTEVPAAMQKALGEYLGAARLLGRRTAEMHLALADYSSGVDFAPEPFTAAYQHEMFKDINDLASLAFHQLNNHLGHLPEDVRGQARFVLDRQNEIRARFKPLAGPDIRAERTRVHGDYHLGQVLYTGSDFVIIDFEGEPVRSIVQRRQKRSPLKDVAGMLRSFHYAAYAALFDRGEETGQVPGIERWTDAWHIWVGAAFLKEYLQVAGSAPFLPHNRQELQMLLDVLLLEKGIYELIYELNNRPDWVKIPLAGVAQLAGK